MTQEQTKKKTTINQRNLETIAKEDGKLPDYCGKPVYPHGQYTPEEVDYMESRKSNFRYNSPSTPEEVEDHNIPSSNYYYSDDYDPDLTCEGMQD